MMNMKYIAVITRMVLCALAAPGASLEDTDDTDDNEDEYNDGS